MENTSTFSGFENFDAPAINIDLSPINSMCGEHELTLISVTNKTYTKTNGEQFVKYYLTFTDDSAEEVVIDLFDNQMRAFLQASKSVFGLGKLSTNEILNELAESSHRFYVNEITTIGKDGNAYCNTSINWLLTKEVQ